MILSDKTLESLRDIITDKPEYRTGPQLVKFFNGIGFNDKYEKGFPSRWFYVQNKLSTINGQPELDKCIKKVFAPINFVGKENVFQDCLKEFNDYLRFDGWVVSVVKSDIEIHKVDKPDVEKELNQVVRHDEISDDLFLKVEFADVSVESLPIPDFIKSIIADRLLEMSNAFVSKAYLSSVIMAGSILEGLLLGLAENNPASFNKSTVAPKTKEKKVKLFPDWTLNDFINVSSDLGWIKEDVKKFSHTLRDFRNYIHPYEQYSSRFSPDEHTAKICIQVLKAALCQITEK